MVERNGLLLVIERLGNTIAELEQQNVALQQALAEAKPG